MFNRRTLLKGIGALAAGALSLMPRRTVKASELFPGDEVRDRLIDIDGDLRSIRIYNCGFTRTTQEPILIADNRIYGMREGHDIPITNNGDRVEGNVFWYEQPRRVFALSSPIGL